MKTKKELIEQYVSNANKIDDINREQRAILDKLASMSEHKVGEIVKWTEGLNNKEHSAVVTKVSAYVYVHQGKFEFDGIECELHEVKKDGKLSKYRCYPSKKDYVWTGLTYDFESNK